MEEAGGGAGGWRLEERSFGGWRLEVGGDRCSEEVEVSTQEVDGSGAHWLMEEVEATADWVQEVDGSWEAEEVDN